MGTDLMAGSKTAMTSRTSNRGNKYPNKVQSMWRCSLRAGWAGSPVIPRSVLFVTTTIYQSDVGEGEQETIRERKGKSLPALTSWLCVILQLFYATSDYRGETMKIVVVRDDDEIGKLNILGVSGGDKSVEDGSLGADDCFYPLRRGVFAEVVEVNVGATPSQQSQRGQMPYLRQSRT